MNLVRVVFISVPDAATGAAMARRLVEERLVACASLLPPMTSVYRWDGALQEAQEQLLLLKTVHDRVPALVERVKELHPHKVPECLVLPVETGLPSYLSWVVDETARITV